MNQLSVGNNRLKFKTSGKLLIILEEYIERIYFKVTKKDQKVPTPRHTTILTWKH